MKNKTGLVISREYLSRVKKKSFLLITILVPTVIIGFYAGIIMIQFKGGSDKQRLAVIDDAHLLTDSSIVNNKDIVFIKNETEGSFAKKYRKQGFDAFLYVPKFNIDSPGIFQLHSPASASLPLMNSVERKLNKAIETKRLTARGLTVTDYDRIGSDVRVDNTVDTDKGAKKGSVAAALIISYVCGILIYMMMIIYGTQVMRGVSEEKTNRIAEVIVSSVKPFQLMTGKIIGIGAVGLTQFAIWIVLMFCMQMLLPVFFPSVFQQMTEQNGAAGAAVPAAQAVMQGISSLPLLKIGLSFIFYFLGGYLTYASLFAAIGSMTTDDQQDTQQLIFPVLMPIILGFVIMSKAVSDPNSSLAVFGSLFPLTSPIVMMGRITYDVPAWQIAVSAALLIGTFIFLAWLTGRIYRTGILMYGKKASWKEMFKWAVRG